MGLRNCFVDFFFSNMKKIYFRKMFVGFEPKNKLSTFAKIKFGLILKIYV